MVISRSDDINYEELLELLEFATPEETKYIERLLSARVALESPLDYACYVSPQTIRYKHVEVVSDYIQSLCEFRLYHSGPGPVADWFYRTEEGTYPIEGPDELREFLSSDDGAQVIEFFGLHPDNGERVVFRLGLSAPPRHGKSWITTLHTPGWYLSRWPDRKQAIVTYSDEFSWEWGEQINRQLDERNGFVETKGNRQLIRETKRFGELRFAGVGGKLTGTGYHFGLIDDPFKNSEEALSQVARDSKDNWYGSVWLTRKEPMAVEVVMFTRWHEDDLSGRRIYLSNSTVPREDWCVLEMPAIAFEPEHYPRDGYKDVIDRKPGEALCPARKTLKELEDIRKDDPLWFEAMYQGNPSLEAGGILSPPYHHWSDAGSQYKLTYDDDRHLMIPKRNCVRFGVIDLAASLKTWADWSVMSIWDWHRDSQNLMLVHMDRQRIESARHLEWAQGLCREWDVTTLGIEERSFGLTLIQLFQRAGGFYVRPLFPKDRDKVQRAIPYGAGISNQQVWFPQGASWLFLWEQEHRNFPNAKHDDMVDTGAYAWEMTRSMPAYVQRRKKVPTLEDRCWAQLEERSKEPDNWSYMMR